MFAMKTRALMCFLFLAAPALLTQQPAPQQRQVNVKALNLYAPLQVTAVLSLGKTYTVPRGPHQVVELQDGNPDWIGDLFFTVENHSPKDIVAIEAMVYVPAWEEDAKHLQHLIRFHEGQFPAQALHFGDGTPIPEESSLKLDVKPGASANVPLRQALAKLAEVRDRNPPLLAVPLASADSIWIQLERIFFADGTMWEFNSYLKPNPSSSAGYVPITQEEWKSLARTQTAAPSPQ